MSVSIVNIRPATSDEWDTIWQGCDYSTYFHSREWAEIWNVYTKGKMRPEPIVIEFSDGKKALLPLSLEKGWGGFLKRYISSPAGTFGGWISEDELTIEHAKLLVEYMIGLGNLIWRENPYDPNLSKINIPYAKEDFTQVIDLRQGFDAIYKNWTKGHTSTARKASKALREGVIISQAKSLKEWRIYYDIYKDSLRRWGEKASSSYEWFLFEIMFNKQSTNIKLWLAYYNEEITSGALYFYHNRHIVYWHGAGYEKYFNLRPVNLIKYDIIMDACSKGYWWCDFNPSGGHEGVKAFKKSFGAEMYPSKVLIRKTRIKKVIDMVPQCLRLIRK